MIEVSNPDQGKNYICDVIPCICKRYDIVAKKYKMGKYFLFFMIVLRASVLFRMNTCSYGHLSVFKVGLGDVLSSYAFYTNLSKPVSVRPCKP